MDNSIFIGDWIVIRLRESVTTIATILSIVALHADLLHVNETVKDWITLAGFVFIALSRPVAYKQDGEK